MTENVTAKSSGNIAAGTVTSNTPIPQDEEVLVGPNICLMGGGGTGKTYALGTICDWAERNNSEVAILFTENSLETLLGYYRDKGKEPPACVYWHQQLTRPIPLKNLIAAADKAGKLSYEALTKAVDSDRGGENNAFWKILNSCFNFVDDRTGKELGPVDQFPLTRIFAMDSLTETSNAAFKMIVGSKPTASKPDYGVSQNNLMNFLRLLTQGCICPFVMTAHVEKETDEVTGGSIVTISAIGRALAAVIPPLFSDVLFTVRQGNKFTWDLAAFGVDVKTRSLEYKAGITPDLGVIMDVWKKRSGV